MSDEARGSLPTRETLLERVKNPEDRESWQEFFTLYHGRVYNFALQRGMNAQEAEDVVQETFVSVIKNMPHFHYDSARGKFRSWLLHLAQWRIGDAFRKRRKLGFVHIPPNEQTRTEVLERIPDSSTDQSLEARICQEWRQAVFDAALAKVKTQVSAKQFQAYDLYAIKGWPAAKVAVTLGIRIASVHLQKHRISKLIKAEIKALDKDRI